MADKTDNSYAVRFGEPFQRHILAVALRTPGFVLRYRSALDFQYFPVELHRIIAKALFDHCDQYRMLPTQELLLEDIRPGVDEATLEHVSRLCEKMYDEDISDAPAVMNKVVEFGKTQAMCNAVIEGAELIEKGKRDKVGQLIKTASQVGEDLLDIGLDYRLRLAELLANDREENANADAIPTGIHHLDLLMNGGLGRGELGVILAPPGRGKTTTLINIAFGALVNPMGYNVFHYTLEMSERKVASRYSDRLAGALLTLRTKDPEEYRAQMEAKANKFLKGNLIIKGYPTRKAGVSTLRSHLSLMASQGMPPDLIVIDYGDIVKPERRVGEMRHEQAGIYEDLRELAGEFNAATWTGSQAGKGALEKKTLSIADFAESFEKAAIVDAALALCQTNDDMIDKKCRLFAAKLRNSEDGSTIECSIDRTRCYIKSLSLTDAAGTRIDTDEQDEADGQVGDPDKAAALASRTGGSAISKIKAAAGIKPTGPVKKGPQKKERIDKKVGK